jgi:uncharacterized protein (TIGR00255 family)
MVNPTPRSMTGFATRSGGGFGQAWVWEARSVNGKGLDVRVKLPDGLDGLDQAVRAAVTKRFTRGNISINLKLERAEGETGARLDPAGLARVLAALEQIEVEAKAAGFVLRESSAAEILALRGVTEQAAKDGDPIPLRAALVADLDHLLTALGAARAQEGAALGAILSAQVAHIGALAEAAGIAARDRASEQAEALSRALAKVMETADGVDPARVAQELALIAVKSDVTEEIDRLQAHVAAARDLLNSPEPVGRRFDFLAQEFNREANTLASKAGSAALTRIALDLKVAIDQMREQIQNVE